MPLASYPCSYIIGGWIWLSTWGIYQIPLSWLAASILFRKYITKSLTQGMTTCALFYGSATFAYWILLFLPIHLLTPQEYHTAIIPSAKSIALFCAATYCIIQLCFYQIINQKYPKKITRKMLLLLSIANGIGALLAIYSLRFVDTILDW